MKEIHEIQNIWRAGEGKYSSLLKAVETLDKADCQWDYSASVHILRNYTLESLEPFIKFSAYRRNIKITASFSDYDTYQQEVLDPFSRLRQRSHELVVLALWLDNLPVAFDRSGTFLAEAVWEHLTGLINQLEQKVSSHIALNTFLQPVHHTSSWKALDGLAALNQQLRDLALKDDRLLLVDFDRLAACVGSERTLDLRYWFLFKSPLRIEFLQLWGDVLAQAVASLKGCARKVLVLDCDNTLWGGIIGEEGAAGIKLSQNDFPGNVYQAFHKQILELQRRGVLIALCSKNNEADVMEVLDTHPDCLIRREHLVAWRINWEDKVNNLQALAQELNLGLDSFVFIDDNPVECELIRKELPMVDVLQVPQKIYEMPSLLQRYSGFYRLATTAEDSSRTVLYQAQRQRDREAKLYRDIDDFLAELHLEVEIGQAKPDELPRVAQLTQKTNQFNLTARRYGLGDIEAFSASENYLVLIMNVADKYGKYGLTGVAIAVREQENCRIDTFLMSCRILGRKLEDVFLSELLRAVGEKLGTANITAEYIPSPKNAHVSDLLDKRGFRCVTADAQRRLYVFSGHSPIQPADYIKVFRR
jgi:FkbH-like protein